MQVVREVFTGRMIVTMIKDTWKLLEWMDDNPTHQRTGEQTSGGSQLIGDQEGRVILVEARDGKDMRGVGRHGR
jgi:hypothetical protein